MAKQMLPGEVKALPLRDVPYDTAVGGAVGLVLRIAPNGRRTFRLRYTAHGKRRWYFLGDASVLSLSDARKEARKILGRVAMGGDPAAEKSRERRERRLRGTVADMVDRYVDEYAKERKRSWREDDRTLRKDLVPLFGSMPVQEFNRGHVLEVLERARQRGVQGGRNNLFSITRKLCSWAVSQGILDDNPTRGIERPAPLGERDRTLSREELGQYWRGMQTLEVDDRTRLALQLQCVLGLRIGEVTGARKIEVQLAERKFVIPAERMKNGRAHVVPLPDLAVALFEEAMSNSRPDSMHLFLNLETGQPILAKSVVRALARHQEHFAFAEKFRTHDVRRTMSTMLIEAGTQPAVVDRLLAHAPAGVLNKHYNTHSYLREKREALDLWSSIVIDAASRKKVAR